MNDRWTRPWTRGKAILVGGLVAGALDITYAFVLWWLRAQVTPVQILQSVAAGWLGKASYEGGTKTAVLGALTHFFNALVIAAIFVGASRVWPILARRATLFGPLYGIGVYLVMNSVVIPLSNFPRRGGSPAPVVWITGVLAHMFLIGLPIALAARRTLPAAS
jgi:uncharacterized membrane protein YagU involved in acid resistance